MKSEYLALAAGVFFGHAAIAADSSDRSHPIDANPACMDRNKDSTSPDCTPQTEGQPRHYVRPGTPVAPPVTKPPGQSAPAALLRK